MGGPAMIVDMQAIRIWLRFSTLRIRGKMLAAIPQFMKHWGKIIPIALAFVAGVVGGRWLTAPTDPVSANAPDAGRPMRPASVQERRPQPTLDHATVPMPAVAVGYARLHAIDDMERALDTARVERHSMGLAAIEFAIGQLDAEPNSIRREMLLRILMERWGELDFTAAWEYAQTTFSNERPRLLEAALIGLARTDPQRAWQIYMDVSERGGNVHFRPQYLLRMIAQDDVMLALSYYGDLAVRSNVLRYTINDILYTVDNPELIPLLATAARHLPSPMHAQVAERAIWHHAGYISPLSAIAQLDALDSNGVNTSDHLGALFSGWGKADGLSALQYIYGKMTESEQTAYAPIALKAWAEYGERNLILEHLNTIPRDYLSDRTIMSIADTIVEVDVPAALEWISSIESDALRERAFDDAIWRWAKTDYESMRQYSLSIDDSAVRSSIASKGLLSLAVNGILQPNHLDLIQDINSNWLRYIVLKGLITNSLDPIGNIPNASVLPSLEAEVRKATYMSADHRTELLRALGIPVDD